MLINGEAAQKMSSKEDLTFHSFSKSDTVQSVLVRVDGDRVDDKLPCHRCYSHACLIVRLIMLLCLLLLRAFLPTTAYQVHDVVYLVKFLQVAWAQTLQ